MSKPPSSARDPRPTSGVAVDGSAVNTPAGPAKAGGVPGADDHAANLLLIQQMRAVICDFLPNIGNCVLQDYGLLNEVLVKSRAVLHTAGMVIPERAK